ncbi:MAG: DUF3237 domain-containing protein [Xanthomonadales bacterium]|nr:DUF3237 domain-containing protein [Xanthomonadales bacterium]
MNRDSTTAPELLPLCTVDLELSPATIIGEGPSGTRMVIDLVSMTLTGERLNAKMKGRAAADWLTIVGSVATIDVRATVETDDGALIYIQYRGRADVSQGIGSSPVYVAPTFETSDPRYQWLNCIQAVGKGDLKALRYEWMELR